MNKKRKKKKMRRKKNGRRKEELEDGEEGEVEECEKHGLPCAYYNETCKCSAALSADNLYRIATRSGDKSEKYG